MPGYEFHLWNLFLYQVPTGFLEVCFGFAFGVLALPHSWKKREYFRQTPWLFRSITLLLYLCSQVLPTHIFRPSATKCYQKQRQKKRELVYATTPFTMTHGLILVRLPLTCGSLISHHQSLLHLEAIPKVSGQWSLWLSIVSLSDDRKIIAVRRSLLFSTDMETDAAVAAFFMDEDCVGLITPNVR